MLSQYVVTYALQAKPDDLFHCTVWAESLRHACKVGNALGRTVSVNCPSVGLGYSGPDSDGIIKNKHFEVVQ